MLNGEASFVCVLKGTAQFRIEICKKVVHFGNREACNIRKVNEYILEDGRTCAREDLQR